MSAMDSLSGGSRLGRLPLLLVKKAFGVGRGTRLWRWAGVVAAASSVAMVVEPVVPASAATYRARDGASLQAALASADASSGPSTIELNAGAFLPTSTLIIRREITIVGPSSPPGAQLAGGAVEPFPSSLLLVEAHAKLTLWNVELTGGGGVGSDAAIDDSGTVDIESSTVAGNNGPGLLVRAGATATARNSTLSNGLDFGVIDQGTASLFNSTVAANANGGIDSSAGRLNLTNTLVATNKQSDCTKPATTSDHSLDSDGTCGVGPLSRTDPGLERLAGNGGPTPTQAPSSGSAAIGAGDESRCPIEDQHHFTRTGGHCDLGAYQVDGVRRGAGTPPSSTGPGAGPSFEGVLGRLVGVSGHGTLRGARHRRIAFTVRAEVGRARATLLYADPARHIRLGTLTLRSTVIDGRRGIATLRGSSVEMPTKRRVGLTIVLTSNSAHHNVRVRLSNGYFESGRLLNGTITFMRSAGRSSIGAVAASSVAAPVVGHKGAAQGRPASFSNGVFVGGPSPSGSLASVISLCAFCF
jgi:hypothetical protein